MKLSRVLLGLSALVVVGALAVGAKVYFNVRAEEKRLAAWQQTPEGQRSLEIENLLKTVKEWDRFTPDPKLTDEQLKRLRAYAKRVQDGERPSGVFVSRMLAEK